MRKGKFKIPATEAAFLAKSTYKVQIIIDHRNELLHPTTCPVDKGAGPNFVNEDFINGCCFAYPTHLASSSEQKK